MEENDGQRPLIDDSGGAQYDVGGTMMDVIDMCDIVKQPSEDLLRVVPDGCYQGASNDNFDAAGCQATLGVPAGGTGSYVWVMDVEGNVYSVCDSDDSGAIEADENCDGFSGCEWETKEVWP